MWQAHILTVWVLSKERTDNYIYPVIQLASYKHNTKDFRSVAANISGDS